MQKNIQEINEESALLQRALAPDNEQRWQRLLNKVGLTESILANANVTHPELLQRLFAPSRLRYLHLNYLDNIAFKLLLFPFLGRRDMKPSSAQSSSSLARVWPQATSLLFESPRVLAQTYMTTDFIRGTRFASDMLFAGTIYSLMAIELVNYAKCYQAYSFAYLMEVLIGSANPLVNLLSDKRYLPYIAALLPGVPLLWGFSKAFIAAFDAKPVNKQDLDRLHNLLTHYVPNFRQDTLRWLLPLSAFSRAHKHITRILIWDGRDLVIPERRNNLINSLCKHAETSRHFTQLSALESLAEVINGIALADIPYLREVGFSKETLAALLYSQQQALQTLRRHADHYTLNTSSGLHLGRYVYANYLLWQIGQPSKKILRPIFWALESVQAYARLSLFTVFFRIMVEVIHKAYRQHSCQNAGKLWSYIGLIHDYNCTVCPDLGLFYSDTWTDIGCFEGYVREPRLAAQLIYAVQRFKLDYLPTLTLTHHGLNNSELGLVLQALKETHTKVGYLQESYYYVGSAMSFADARRIADSLSALNLHALTLNYRKIGPDNARILVPALTNLKKLDLSWNKIGDAGLQLINDHLIYLNQLDVSENDIKFLQANLNSLLQGQLRDLRIGGNPIIDNGLLRLGQQLNLSQLLSFTIARNDYWNNTGTVAPILERLPWASLTNLDLNNNKLSTYDLIPLFSSLNQTQLQALNLQVNLVDSEGAQLLANGLNLANLQTLDLGFNPIADQGLIALVQELGYSALQTLLLRSIQITDNSLIALGKYLQLSSVKVLDLSTNYDLTDQGLALFLQTALQAKLLALELSQVKLGDTSIQALADYLPKSSLKTLRLTSDFITDKNVAVLLSNLQTANLAELDLSFNFLGDGGAIALAKHLTASQLVKLNLVGNQIGNYGIRALAQALPGSKLAHLTLGDNRIEADGAKALATALVRPSCAPLIAWETSLTFTKDIAQTRLTYLDLMDNHIDTEGAIALCRILPSTDIAMQNFHLLYNNEINSSLLDTHTCHFTSSANALRAPWPYILLYRSYQRGVNLAIESYHALQQAIVTGEPTSQALVIQEEPAPSIKATHSSVSQIAGYSALYLSLGYLIKEGINNWCQAKVEHYVPTDRLVTRLNQLARQSKELANTLKHWDEYSLCNNQSQQDLLTYLQANLVDSQTMLIELKQKRKVAEKQLQQLEDDFADIDFGIKELRQEIKLTHSRLRFFSGKTVPCYFKPAASSLDRNNISPQALNI
jgi:Ran GTPase-activating protein (RanGAP) involved in mRNA processing and transport